MQRKKQKTLVKNLLLICKTIFFILFFLQCIKITQGVLMCDGGMNQNEYNIWTYKETMEKIIFQKRGFLCRTTGFFCYDKEVMNDPEKKSIMDLWSAKGQEADFSKYLQSINFESFKYFCLNIPEKQCSYFGNHPMFRKECRNPCPSKLRLTYPEVAKNCHNIREI
jgi:hypothetical protein